MLDLDSLENLRQRVRQYSPHHWDDAERQNQDAYEKNRVEWFKLQDDLDSALEQAISDRLRE